MPAPSWCWTVSIPRTRVSCPIQLDIGRYGIVLQVNDRAPFLTTYWHWGSGKRFWLCRLREKKMGLTGINEPGSRFDMRPSGGPLCDGEVTCSVTRKLCDYPIICIERRDCIPSISRST